jgi:hypothetical protein
MNKQEAIQLLGQMLLISLSNKALLIRSWGKVDVLQIAIRIENNEIITINCKKQSTFITYSRRHCCRTMILFFLKSFRKEKKCR